MGHAPSPLTWAKRADGWKFVFRTAVVNTARAQYSDSAEPALSLLGPLEIARECPEVGTVLAPPRARRKGPSSRVRERGPAGIEMHCPPVRHGVAALGSSRLPGLP